MTFNTTGQTMNPNTTSWTRARVSLLGHTALGVVRLRYTDGGGIELSDGRRYGPGAVFSIKPLPFSVEPTRSELDALEEVLDAGISENECGRWSVSTGHGIAANQSLLSALADTISLILDAKNADILALRERLSAVEAQPVTTEAKKEASDDLTF